MGRLLTTAQVCEKLSISRRHLQTLRKRGVFRTIRISPRSLRFDEDDIDAYIRKGGLETERVQPVIPAPRIRRVTGNGPDRHKDYEWLDRHGPDYPGEWVALADGRLLAHARSLSDLQAHLSELELADVPLVHQLGG